MAAEEAFVIDSARTIEDIVPAQHRWLFTRRGEEGLPLLTLHPRKNNDDYRRVTFLAEATRPARIVDVEQSATITSLVAARSAHEKAENQHQ